MTEVETRTALVLGANGGVGGETAAALARHGWKVRALVRAPARSAPRAGWDYVIGDAMDRDAVVAAARGANVIVHAVNPPGYRGWNKLVLSATRLLRARQKALGQRRTPVIALTANTAQSDVAACLAAGADLHIAKPLRPAALLEAIAGFAGRRGDQAAA
ncbi:NAD(P)H-binding protein [Caulobacter endophyticus]|uniref:Response regulatory domain-containing protein n=1 Tax=Caulobacter endophyticus TaxID=2172652 RepID=A0A2T9JXZ1_9CAUL|nr:NAD(P)H-binding protein [Caulobacter endophyticus]PVM88586.1 hypothetical protein DDF67_13035 [Caulobacter endophyticus]